MISISLQGSTPTSQTDATRDSSSTDNLGSQQLAQIIQELLADLKSLLAGQKNNDDGSSSPPVGGGGQSGSPLANYSEPAASSPAGGGGGSSGAPAASYGTPAGSPPGGQTPPVVQNTERQATQDPAGGGGSPAGTGSKLSTNAGGVAQAGAIDGTDPASTKVVNTGTGNDKTFNVTNSTSRPESFTYSVQGQNKATVTLQPGQTGTFVAGSGDIGVRISPSDANGNTKPNEVLYEDGGADNGQASGAGNPDVSKVDGDKDFAGNDENMTVTLSDGRTAGDGDAIRPYMYSTDDAAAMGLAGDPSKTVNIVMSDKS
ncbi:hypothetical protein ACVBGC_01530 [Burkholderia stagnalis]